MFEKLEAAKAMLEYLKGDPVPRLERAGIRLGRVKNSAKFRKLIGLRDSDSPEIRDLNLYTARLSAYEDCCPAAQKICRRLYGQAGGLFDVRAVGIEHAVMKV